MLTLVREAHDGRNNINFLLGLNEKLRVEIPEADYAKLVTLDAVVSCLVAKLEEGEKSGRDLSTGRE